ncbi:hypothetical protein VF04_21820 [Nostoc linckia z7]|uniref:Uncharacterized protein n=2 Tax=Nostoc linckia TaxID=92942 RepID=A0A9Q5ZBF0_NOSLI|nr:hypothetical protein VF02_27670 [Nostoc linckia z1]PHJ60750.1 hypothetical protein VF05_30080 [Nostoc linckia z3]PHJ65769.1 hypothetical protein VF03_27580 [Nostoc linckia z2]PHJ77355.1 hypothetical protein VF06_30420 [Nostoc linckia z4]PHJ81856.1 hypothetical protein VF07_29705 [Nostoc linckia z6]PHJ94547.1 hypothetical protein VF04_21820 [Nostoc linckia z7]PHK02890.1 hypothetical protein VF08_17300 [Nostoc linckia z8]PHK09447.1 hypothetical protein VF09_15630 [Nostoc linckia z9]PHK1944
MWWKWYRELNSCFAAEAIGKMKFYELIDASQFTEEHINKLMRDKVFNSNFSSIFNSKLNINYKHTLDL